MAAVLSVATAAAVTTCAVAATALSGSCAQWGGNIANCFDYLRALGKQKCDVCGALVKHSKYLRHFKICKHEMAEIDREVRERIEDMMEAVCVICKATMKQKDLAQHVKNHADELVLQRAKQEEENNVRIKDRKSRNRRSKNRR